MERRRIEGLIDPDYPHFLWFGKVVDHKQHTNQQGGLDKYVTVVNLDTGEECFKKLYENKRGLHFKHTGYSPMYLTDFQELAAFFPAHWERI